MEGEYARLVVKSSVDIRDLEAHTCVGAMNLHYMEDVGNGWVVEVVGRGSIEEAEIVKSMSRWWRGCCHGCGPWMFGG